MILLYVLCSIILDVIFKSILKKGKSMSIFSNGSAVIGGVYAPHLEVEILRVVCRLNSTGEKPIVPEIVEAMNVKIAKSVCYNLVNRLDKRGGLITKEIITVNVCRKSVPRIIWVATKTSIDFFREHDKK